MPRVNQRREDRPRSPPKQLTPDIARAKKGNMPGLETIREININRLVPNPKQPRKKFNDGNKINELARSIKQQGLIQPIIVRKKNGKKKNKFEIVVGERRWRACKAARLPKIPAIVRDVNDHQVLLQSLIENLHRSDLTSIERENAVYELWSSGKYRTKRALANNLGYRESSINELIEAKEFRTRTTSAAEVSTKVIAQTRAIKNDELRAQVIRKIHEDQITSDEIRRFVKKIKTTPKSERKELLKESYKIDDESQDRTEDKDKEEVEEVEEGEEEKENTFITQIQTLERTVDEFAQLDNDIIGSLSRKEKTQMKARLGAIAEKLDEVMKRL